MSGKLQALQGGTSNQPGDALAMLGREYRLAKPNGQRVTFTPTPTAMGPFTMVGSHLAKHATGIELSQQARSDGWVWLDRPSHIEDPAHRPQSAPTETVADGLRASEEAHPGVTAWRERDD